MGHKPDQKARRKRREREAKKAAAPAKPRGTVRELFDKKREMIAKNRADFDKKLGEAPRAVQDEYRRCSAEIDRHLHAQSGKVSATLYPAEGKPAALTGIQVAWVLDLLSHPANGWQVSLSKPLSGGDDSDVKILFRFDPHED